MVRAYDRRFIASLNLKAMGTEVNTEIIYKAQLLRARIEEIPGPPRLDGDRRPPAEVDGPPREQHDPFADVGVLLPAVRVLHRAGVGHVDRGDRDAVVRARPSVRERPRHLHARHLPRGRGDRRFSASGCSRCRPSATSRSSSTSVPGSCREVRGESPMPPNLLEDPSRAPGPRSSPTRRRRERSERQARQQANKPRTTGASAVT